MRRIRPYALMLLLAIAGLAAGCAQTRVDGARTQLFVSFDPTTGKLTSMSLDGNKDTAFAKLLLDLQAGRAEITDYAANGSNLGAQQERLGTVQSNNATLVASKVIDLAGNVIGMYVPGVGLMAAPAGIAGGTTQLPSGGGVSQPTTPVGLSDVKQFALDKIYACPILAMPQNAELKARLIGLTLSPVTQDAWVSTILRQIPSLNGATTQPAR